MNNLEPFDFTPDYQPDADDVVSFRLQPLDLKGQYELQRSMDEDGLPAWSGIETASKYIVGWTGKRLGEFSRAELRKVIQGGASSEWMIWLGHIAGKLYVTALVDGDLKKKSS